MVAKTPLSLAPAASLALVLFLSGCGGGPLDELLDAARSDEIEQQRLALRRIADLGAEALPAVPLLVELARHRHPDIRRLSGLALGNVAVALPPDHPEPRREEIVEVLTRQLGDEDLSVRNTAAFALLDLDPSHVAAQKRLEAAMQRGDGGIIVRLTHTQPLPAWAVPALITILERNPRPSLRRLAAVALGEIDPSGEAARSALQKAVKDGDDQVRAAAQTALKAAP